MISEEFMTELEIEDLYGIDLATAETIRGGFLEVTRHMHRTLQRSAFSNVVRELLDFGVCVHTPTDSGTELVAITEGCTHFAFTHAHMMNFIVDEWGSENFGPGDTIVCNDPWRGSIHLPDVNLFRPVFWEGELVFYLSDAAHLVDIGGGVAGGFNNVATEVFEEGLRIPPMLITSGDKPVRSTINLILENTRTPQHNLGDLRALFGTMSVGEGRLHRLLERYGLEKVRAAARYTVDLAHRRMRGAIASISDGIYEAEEWIDDAGPGTGPLRLHITGRVAGSNIELDFSGTDRQPLASLTTCWEETSRVLIGAKMLLDPNHPMNSGAMRPFHVVAPAGSAVMGLPPTSSSQHSEVATAVSSLSLKLFGQMLPDRAVGSDGKTSSAHVFSGMDHRPGRGGQPFGFIVMGGLGWGGTPHGDGMSLSSTPVFGVSTSVFELMERDGPVILRGFNTLIDAAGAGQHRAGLQSGLMIECSGDMSWTMVLDSTRFTRPGAAGGGNGMTSYAFRVRKDADGSIPYVNGLVPLDHLSPLLGLFDRDGVPDPEFGEWNQGTEFSTTKMAGVACKQGDVLFLVAAGGGGYGDPTDREPALVLGDVWNEVVSLRAAEGIYGVVVDPLNWTVDAEATAQARLRIREGRKSGTGGIPVAFPRPWPRTAASLRAEWGRVGQPTLRDSIGGA